MRNLETQIGQLASALNNRPPGRLPSDTQVPRMEGGKECKAIELRSGKELAEPHPREAPAKTNPPIEEKKENEESWIEVEKPILKPEPAKYMSRLPFPKRQKKKMMNQNFQNFLNTFRKPTINILFAEALE